ncbi:MAG: 2-C-methyl-D-erythritol 4-phosphate cytidylyltransferase [Gammaproteobacteria bacterium]|nr:2-C-methyl-D-erythritol 4-phosphate cytidylyltransferase [Gammaproteobacteria bacterium]
MAEPAFWAVVPAAGSGERMQAGRPKQYLELRGRPVIVHTLERLASFPPLRGIVVGLSPDDRLWPNLETIPATLLSTYAGGRERAVTVLNGLLALAAHADPDDWVLVHDAVRPCLRPDDIAKLAAAVEGHPDGGLLAVPVTDTVKRADMDARVIETVARERLWRALTPQMFRLAALRQALERALRDTIAITDEAAAIEYCGGRPLLVAGQPDNIKITYAGDLALAEFYMQRQEQGA